MSRREVFAVAQLGPIHLADDKASAVARLVEMLREAHARGEAGASDDSWLLRWRVLTSRVPTLMIRTAVLSATATKSPPGAQATDCGHRNCESAVALGQCSQHQFIIPYYSCSSTSLVVIRQDLKR